MDRHDPGRVPARVAEPASSRIVPPFPVSGIRFETRSLPTLTRSYPRRFAFYVANPVGSIPQFFNVAPSDF